MLLLLHITVALTSVGFSTFVFFRPSVHTLRVSYGLIAATFASGSVLLVRSPSHLVESCLFGIFFVGVASIVTLSANRKLATQKIRSKL